MVFHPMELTKVGTAFLYTIGARNVKIQMSSDVFRFLDKNKGSYRIITFGENLTLFI